MIYAEDLVVVSADGYRITRIKDQTEELCMYAVENGGMALRYCKIQTPEICLDAVRNNPYALYYVKEQTPELIRVAIKKAEERYGKLPENFKAIVDWDLLIMEEL